MSDGVEHCPAIYWRNNEIRLRLKGERFKGSGRSDLIGRPVDLGYVPGEKELDEEPVDVTGVLGQLITANDSVQTGD